MKKYWSVTRITLASAAVLALLAIPILYLLGKMPRFFEDFTIRPNQPEITPIVTGPNYSRSESRSKDSASELLPRR